MAKQKFQVGDLVVLPPDPDASLPEQPATVEEYEGRGMYIVRVAFSEDGDPEDDLIREVHQDILQGPITQVEYDRLNAAWGSEEGGR